MTSELNDLIDIEEIKKLKGTYCLCVATGDWSTFESLFTEDLRFITPSDGVLYEPRARFMEFHRKNIQEQKLWGVIRCFTPIITITGADTASGIWGLEDLHIWPETGDVRVGHHGYGRYYEDYVRTPQGWRFKQIQVVFDRLEPLEGGFGGRAPDTVI